MEHKTTPSTRQFMENTLIYHFLSEKQIRLTDFGFLPLDPGGGPGLKADEDGCTDGCIPGDGAPVDNEATDCDVFVFLRDAETVGLGAGSWPG